MNNKEALNKLALGRGYVLSRAEYIASTLLELTPIIVDAPGVTMGITPGLVLYVGGRWFLSDPEVRTDEITGGCLYHECEHVLRGFDRLKALPKPDLANVAADEAINYNLREESWDLPSWVCYPERYGHPPALTMEQYYALLEQQLDAAKQSLQQFMDEAAGGSGEGHGSSGNAPDGDEQGKGNSPGNNQGNNDDSSDGQQGGWQKKIGGGVCGSGAGNAVNEQLEKELDSSLGKGEAEVDAIRRTTLDDIQKYMDVHGRGSVPGRFKQLIETRIQPPLVDWKRELRKTLRYSHDVVAGARNYSMRRPSIGGALTGVCTSGLVDSEVRVCIVEDTSLSMGTSQLQDARNEGYHVLKKLGVRTAWHIQADTRIQHVGKVNIRRLPAVPFSGRGGTDFRPVFEELKKLHPRPNLVVFYTDGDGPAPIKPPSGIQVVWCIVRTPYARKPAHWGKVVVCDKLQTLKDPIQ